jgi:hypothetical protein
MRDIYYLALSVFVWLGEETAETDRIKRFLSNFTGDFLPNKLDDLSAKLADIETSARNMGQRKQPLGKVVRSEFERLVVAGMAKGLVGLVKALKIGVDTVYNSLDDHSDGKGLGWSLDEITSWSPSGKQLKRVEGEDFREMGLLFEKTLMLDTQYFNRMWTLQEVCVANWGLVLVPAGGLDDFLRAFYYLQRTYDISVPSMHKITNLMEVCYKFNDGQRQSLRSLLFVSSGRESENPRDRIYALYGLMKDEMNPLLQPDYTKPVAEVYANTTRHLIIAGMSLDILCGHQFLGRLDKLPSWVPDFRQFGLETGALVQASGKSVIYRASLSEHHVPPKDAAHPPQEWQALTVTGIFVGTVSILSDTLVPDPELKTEGFVQSENLWAAKLIESQEWKPEELEAISRVSDLVRRYAEFYLNSNRDTFWARNPDKLQKLRSVTGGANDESGSALNLHFKYFLTLLCGRTATESRCKEEELAEHMRRSCIPNPEGIKALERLCSSLEAGTRHRRFIVCEENRIGAAPEETQKGDMVCVLMGCSVPVILRKTAKLDEYEFVGECYLHDFMDGEALAMRDGDGITAREFKLV